MQEMVEMREMGEMGGTKGVTGTEQVQVQLQVRRGSLRALRDLQEMSSRGLHLTSKGARSVFSTEIGPRKARAR